MAAPTLINTSLAVSTASNNTSTVSSSLTVLNGDILVIKAIAEGSATIPGTPTGGSQTYTTQVTDSTASTCYTKLYTAVISGSPAAFTVTVPWTGGSGWHSMIVEQWRGGTLAGTPATVDTRGTGAPSATISTVGTDSIVSWSNGDFSAKAPGSRAYRSSATESGIHDKSTASYVAYYAYQSAAVAGSQTIGLTLPTAQTFKLVGIEIQGTGGGAPTPITFITYKPPWRS